MSGSLPSILRVLSRFVGSQSGAVSHLETMVKSIKDFDVGEFVRWIQSQENERTALHKKKIAEKKNKNSKIVKKQSILRQLKSVDKKTVSKIKNTGTKHSATKNKASVKIIEGKDQKNKNKASVKISGSKTVFASKSKNKVAVVKKNRDTLLASFVAKQAHKKESTAIHSGM